MEGNQQYIPVVGQPVAFGIGFAVLVLVAFSPALAASLVAVAHEGGHIAMALLTGRGVGHFKLEPADEDMFGETGVTGIDGFGVSDILIGIAGYAAPPLLGLGGAYVVADGNSWGVLWIGIVLLAAMLLTKTNGLAAVVTLLALAGLLWAAVSGGPTVQASAATGLVWLMLIGGLRTVIVHWTKASDAAYLSDATWIPRFVWAALWVAIAVASIWSGGRLLLDL